MKVSFFSFAVNDKFHLDIMYRQFKKFIKDDDYEFILFNDAVDQGMEATIAEIAMINDIRCIRVPQSIHQSQNPSEGYAATLNWAVRDYAVQSGCEIIVLMHSDVFPLRDVYIKEILGDNVAASTVEFRVVEGEPIHYFYPAFTIINMKAVESANDLDFSIDLGKLDTGGMTHLFIKKYLPKIKFIDNPQIHNQNAISKYPGLFDYFWNDAIICREHALNAGWLAEGFYHYMAGSQWNAADQSFIDGHQKRMDLFLKYFY